MSQILLLLSLVAALAAGMLAGRVTVISNFQKTRRFASMRSAVLFLLIFTMGFRMGRTPQFVSQIPSLGLAALGFAAATIAGTVAVLWLLFRLTHGRQPAAARPGGRDEHARRGGPPASRTRDADGLGGPAIQARSTLFHALKDPATLLLILVAGFLAGRLIPLLTELDGANLITVILYALLLVIGIGLSAGGVSIKEALTHPNLILIPLGTAVGSLVGGLAVGMAAGMRLGTSLALSAGFGWYSLSGVVLTRLDGPLTGSLAFLANILRESMSLVLIPLLSRTRYPYLAIGSGGATSMDVTLPLIEKNCGQASVPFAMASGAILSLLVPIVVPLLFQIG